MKRTLVIAEVFPPQVGGSGKWLWDIYSQLPHGEFVIAAGQSNGDLAFDQTHDLPVRRLPLSLESFGVLGWRSARAYLHVYRLLSEIARNERIQAVHAGAVCPKGCWPGCFTGASACHTPSMHTARNTTTCRAAES